MIEDMMEAPPATFLVFAGSRRIGSGALAEAAVAARQASDGDHDGAVLVFDAATGEVRDLDLRGTEAEVRVRYAPVPNIPARRGRPKLGVVAREVTLLPRHWEWLASQSGGASVVLRKLVEDARRRDGGAGASRARREAAYRFMSAMAGDLPGFEEGSRALFADDRQRLESVSRSWPRDIRDQVLTYLDTDAEEVGSGG